MIKWIGRQLSKGFDTDPENINRVTGRDAIVGIPLMMAVLWVVMLPLLPLILLIELFEIVAALVLLAAVFAAPITLYAIVNGRGSFMTWAIFLASSWILLGRYVLFPILKQHPSYARLKRRFL